MRITKIDMSHAYWDKYRRFHAYYGSSYKARWVQFENGEVYFLHHACEADARREYKDYGISIVSTADTTFKFATPDEPTKAIPRAYLTQNGQQIFVVDHQHKIAVALGSGTPGAVSMKGAKGYCPGDGAKPVGGVPVRVSSKVSGEQKAELETVRSACIAWWEYFKMEHPGAEVVVNTYNTSYKLVVPGDLEITGYHYQPNALWQNEVIPFDSLTDAQRAIVAERGYANNTDRVLHTYPFVHVLA